MKNDVAILIILYNPQNDFFINNLNIDCKYIVVDNTIEHDKFFVNKLLNYSNLDYIPLYDNMGIAKALNIGALKAVELGYKYIITMDQDSLLTKQVFNELINFYDTTSHC